MVCKRAGSGVDGGGKETTTKVEKKKRMKRHGWRRQWREGCGNDETTSADFTDGIISNIIYISSHFYSICIEL